MYRNTHATAHTINSPLVRSLYYIHFIQVVSKILYELDLKFLIINTPNKPRFQPYNLKCMKVLSKKICKRSVIIIKI